MRDLFPRDPGSFGWPLLEADDLPGAEDWSVLESLRPDFQADADDDRFATLAVSRAFDD